MSDSELSDAPSSNTPPDVELEKALRAAVAKWFKNGRRDEVTVNAIRLDVAQQLGLEQGFFLAHPIWKLESKRIVKDEAVSAPPTPMSS